MIHCRAISDEKLLSQLTESNKILLLGCSLCANISYCIEKDIEMPMYNWLLNPAAVKKEMKRMKKILEAGGYSVSELVILSLCFIRDVDQKKLLRSGELTDTIITLSCEYGKKNIEDILVNKNIICAMHAEGYMRASVEQDGLKLKVRKDKLYINNKKYEEYQEK